MPQLTVSTSMGAAIAGLIADNSLRIIRSARSQVVVDHDFGLAVVKGTQPGTYQLPTSPDEVVIGILARSHFTPNTLGIGSRTKPLQTGDVVDVLTRGPIWVKVEEAVEEGDIPFIRVANGVADNTLTQKGSFRKSPDSGTAMPLLSAVFRKGAAAGGLAMVEFEGLLGSAFGLFLGGEIEISASSAAEAGNAIVLSGQTKNALGVDIKEVVDLHVEVFAPTAAKGAITVTTGTGSIVINGSGKKQEAWVKTSNLGAFALSIADDQAETVLVKITPKDGTPFFRELTFA